MPTILVRPAKDAEFGEIGRLFFDAIHALGPQGYSAQQVHAWAPTPAPPGHWRARTAKLAVNVAVLHGRIAGFIGFSGAGYIDLLFTHPAFTRQGVATALLQDAERNLAGSGITLATSDVSLVARPFFERMGYVVDQEQRVTCRGVELTNFKMSKILTPLCAE
jgi:putative acetyltransferase